MSRTTISWLLGLCLCLSAGLALGLPAEGEWAPDFTLKSRDDDNLRLGEFRGEPVLLCFVASWCGECKQLAGDLAGVQGARILLIATGGKQRGQWGGSSLTVLFDEHSQVAGEYAINRLPTTLILDRDGVVTKVIEGYRGKDMQVIKEAIEVLKEQ